MYIGLRVKYPLFFSDFNETKIFPTDFRNMLKYQMSRKSFQCEPSFYMRTEGRTDMIKLIDALRTFTKTTKTPICLLTFCVQAHPRTPQKRRITA